ncbi:MAG TPA: CapA family protein [Candidatus Limnocylindria bacterium]|nr:CapA family protein [Candidatus Limnocylindria bacterium]
MIPRPTGLFLLALVVCVALFASPSAAGAGHRTAPRTIVFAGDIILGGAINAYARDRGAETLLQDIGELRSADLTIANLESVATTHALTRAEKGGLAPFHFRARPETLSVLTAAGIDAVATANNHSGDYGTSALLEQNQHLARMGIARVGSGSTRQEACAPVFLDAGAGIRIALFSADATQEDFAAEDGPGTCHLDVEDIHAWEAHFAESLAEAREVAHATLFAIHWGEQFSGEPANAQRELGRRLVELGADAVLGTNAHALQGIEVHGDGVIVYDAAHLLSDFDRPVDAAVFSLEVGETGLVGVEVIPVVAETGFARRALPHEADRILDNVTAMSAALGGRFSLDRGRIALRPDPRGMLRTPEEVLKPQRRSPPRPATSPPAACTTSAVPERARIDPVEIGPMTLVGVSIDEERLYLPGLIWIDTYWRVRDRVAEPLWLHPSAAPLGGIVDAWTSHHEPCDWAWPTSRWQPGVIYHDRAALRPPDGARATDAALTMVAGMDDPLQVTIGVTHDGKEVGRTREVGRVHLGAPPALQLLVVIGLAISPLAAGLYIRRRRRGLAETSHRTDHTT